MGTKRVQRILYVWAIVALVLATPAAAQAYDGEVGDIQDTDSITNVYVSGGRATVVADYLQDCPGFISDCWIEVRFSSRCPELWCTFMNQPWRRLNASGVAQANCLGAGNEDNTWRVEYQIAYAAPQVKTVEGWGETEWYVGIGGGVIGRLITEVFFNVSNRTGTRIGTKTTTVTASLAYMYGGEVATSTGIIYTC